MSSKNPSTKRKSVNRARKANGDGNKSRPSPRKGLPNRLGDGGVMIAYGPQIRNDSAKALSPFVVKRRELIGPISSTIIGFQQLNRLRINPGAETTFPWLSRMASLFESYRFRKLRFMVVTRAPTTAAGSVILSPDYDAADGELALTEQQIFANDGSVEAPVWQREVILELKPSSMNRLYKAHTCMGNQRFSQTKQDQKTIDCAQVFVCAEGAGALTIGKLIVDYEVEFFIPQFPTESPTNGGAQFTSSGGMQNAVQNAPLAQNGNVIGGTVFNGVADVNPTATIGQFVKDWQGDVTSSLAGTGITGVGQIYVGDKPGPVDLTKDVLQPILSQMTSGSTLVQATTSTAQALAGQYLKYQAPVNTTLASLKMAMGGSAPITLLV